MSTNSSIILQDSPNRSTASRPGPAAIGWFVLFLGALSAGLLGAVVGSYALGTDPATMAVLAISGYLVGYVLARAFVPDLLAHLFTFVTGVAVALVAIEPRILAGQLRAGNWREILDRYESLLRGFVSSIDSGNKFDADIAFFALALTMWLVGYTAAWMLFRRGWVFWSLVLPGVVLLMALALERDRPAWPALLYLGLALAIAAGQTAMSRSTFWANRGIEQPSGFGRRSIILGTMIALFAVGVGLWYSFDLDDRFKERAMQSGDELANWAAHRFDQSQSNGSASQTATGNYGSFADQFKVGDGVPSGDTPIVVVQANGEEYLAARRMNEYDGTGWKSTTSQTGNDNATQAPRIAFQSDQPMNVPRDHLQSRAQDQATITLLHPTDTLLFTIDQHFSASVSTLVRVGWEPIDTTYTVGAVSTSDVPVDLRELIALLDTATFMAGENSGTPQIESALVAAEFQEIQERLLASYPVSTELSWGNDGSVLVGVKGRLPIYSDVEAVYSEGEPDGGSYSVIGLVPQTSAEELENAGNNYPRYISETYLELPDSITQETRDLANQIAQISGATTPFDEAVAIQNYLRTNFTYQLDAGPAPSGHDIVDYFLFDSKVGRCDHYATSMAVMLRMLGVPTRIVTGLAPVAYDSGMNGYVYRGRNAHSWVEVYFPNAGWVPFEPTPSQSPIGLDRSGIDPISTIEPTPTPLVTEEPQEAKSPATPAPTATPIAAPATVDIDGTNTSSAGPSTLLAGLVAVGGIATLAAGFLWLRRRRIYAGVPVASANFGRLQRLGGYFGIAPSPELTPREYAARFGAAKPDAADGASRVAEAYTQAQYASDVDTVRISRDSDEGWRVAKHGVTDWRFWRRW